jgi:hypothetical protein
VTDHLKTHLIIGIMFAAALPVACDAADGPARAIAPAATATPTKQATAEPTRTPLPTPTPAPTDTATPPQTSTPTAMPTEGLSPPPPTSINGVAIESFIVMPDPVKQRVREIYAAGQAFGRNPRAFSKVGDSTIQIPYFMARFETGGYNLGSFAYLQPIVDTYRGSFARDGFAVRRALHSWSVLNPTWADKSVCQPNEGPLACEFRVHNPGILLIRLGANDIIGASAFEKNIRDAVEYSIANGVVPVLGTKPDRFEGEDNRNNIAIRKLADEYNVPLWDFDLLAETLPGHGLGLDAVHMTTYPPHDYTQAEAFQRGHTVHSLSALIVLDKIMRVTQGGE